jgi:hypothetical protein
LVLPGMRSAVETESAVKKCSLAVIGEVSALASRNQVTVCLKLLAINALASVVIATACVPILTYLASLLWAFKTDGI